MNSRFWTPPAYHAHRSWKRVASPRRARNSRQFVIPVANDQQRSTIVLITGAGGNLGRALATALSGEATRVVRYLNVLFGAALLVTPFQFDAGAAAMINSIVCGVALIALSFRRGPIRQRYGTWQSLIV